MNILEQIMDERRAAVESARKEVPVGDLIQLAVGRTHHSLVEKLAKGEVCVIAETKKASPSAGLLRENYRPAEIARAYADAGAAGISVLTEPRHFQGSEADLRAVREAVDLPVLRKDFICDAYQVHEAAAWGADLVLLIVAALDAGLLRELYEVATGSGLEVLVESHSAIELEVALGLEEAIIGINSRDLKTLKTDIGTALELANEVPSGRLAVAESGIRSLSDIDELIRRGYNGFLIGEALLSGEDPGSKLRELLGK